MENNIFNGYYVNYQISKNFLQKILNFLKVPLLELYYNKINKSICQPDNTYCVPMGLFSNENFKFNGKYIDNNRIFDYIINKKIENKIILNPIQQLIMKKFMFEKNKIKNNNNAPIYLNLVGQCSIGKTVMCIDIICSFGLKTFIVLPSINLSKQWCMEIQKFTNLSVISSNNGASVLLKDKNINNYDVICFPSKHLSNIEFCNFLLNNYSICVIDEQHKINMLTNTDLSYFFTFYTFKLVLSLTATPRLYNALYFGKEINTDDIINKNSIFEKKAYEIHLSKNNYLSTSFNEYIEKYKYYQNLKNKNQNQILMMSNYKKRTMSIDNNRYINIVNRIIKTYNNESFDNIENPKIIVLVKYVDEIAMYYNYICNIIKDYDNLYKIYATKKDINRNHVHCNLPDVKKSIKNKDKYIIIGTADQIGTGIDIVELNILHITFLTTNKNDIIQYAGRVSRDNDTKIHNIYYYAINSYNNLNISNELSIIRNNFQSKNWIIESKI